MRKKKAHSERFPHSYYLQGMSGAYFYFGSLSRIAEEFKLDEPSSRHIVQVLRMKEGDSLTLTDGLGLQATARVLEPHKKRCLVRISDKINKPQDGRRITVALSLLKNSNRFEWFLEKATELGIAEIIPLKCSRTEKQQFRKERMQSLVQGALIQSQQCWMPELKDPIGFPELIGQAIYDQKFIAHCAPGERRQLSALINASLSSQLILIGPEGDFTEEEILMAIQSGFIAVSLGDHRLRAETAAVSASALLKLI